MTCTGTIAQPTPAAEYAWSSKIASHLAGKGEAGAMTVAASGSTTAAEQTSRLAERCGKTHRLARAIVSAPVDQKEWWAVQDSNLRPPACKAGALTSLANRPSMTYKESAQQPPNFC